MTWIAVLAVGVGSYVLRALPMWLHERWITSPRVERVVANAGIAALAALIAAGLRPDVVAPDRSVAVATMAAAAAALAVAARGMTMMRVLLAGGAAYGLVMAVTTLT